MESEQRFAKLTVSVKQEAEGKVKFLFAQSNRSDKSYFFESLFSVSHFKNVRNGPVKLIVSLGLVQNILMIKHLLFEQVLPELLHADLKCVRGPNEAVKLSGSFKL